MEEFAQKLLDKLIELKVIDDKRLQAAFQDSQKGNSSFQEYLITHDLISDEDLGKTVADLFKIPFTELSSTQIPIEGTYIIPENFAKKNKIIVFQILPDQIKVASTNLSQDPTVLQNISQKAKKPVVAYYATERDFEKSLKIYKHNLQSSFDTLIKQEVDNIAKTGISEAPIEKIVSILMEYAYDNRASDIHIEPQKDESIVRFRVDGVLNEVLRFNKSIHDQIILRIKFLAKLRTDEHLNAQDGKIQTKIEDEELDIRVSIVPTIYGENCVLRLLSSRYTQFGLSDLGMDEEDMKKVIDASNNPFGMILATGPTGCGKTTTIYSIVKILNTKDKDIATIEDPVEYSIEGINQIQVNTKTNLTFSQGLKSILRQDPNIIFVGEIRDDETANIAINSALTGHLVLSTVHTNNAATTLPRLIDMKVEPFLIASSISVIIAQRLPRKICESCRVSSISTKEALLKYIPKELIEKYLEENNEVRTYAGKGCPVCNHTGYVGRIGIFEVLVVTEAIKKLITQKADSDIIEAKAKEEGMVTMLENGLLKVKEGLTTLDELVRTIKE